MIMPLEYLEGVSAAGTGVHLNSLNAQNFFDEIGDGPVIFHVQNG